MALQVCEYPTCKKLTLTKRCHAHPLDGFEDDETEPSTPEPTKRSSEELTASIMNVVAQHPAGQKKEPPTAVPVEAHVRKPHTMSAEARKKISQAMKRRHAQAGHHMKTEEPMTTHQREKPAGKCRGRYCRAAALPGSWYCAACKEAQPAQLPAKRAHAPITLAEPTLVNQTPSRGVDLNGNAVTVLDSFINKLSDDLATLQGAKEILEGWRR